MIIKKIRFLFPPYLKCASDETVARVTGWRWRQTWTISIALRATRVGMNWILVERVCIIWWQEIIVVILIVWCDRISWLWRLPWYQHVLWIETSRFLLDCPDAYHDTSTDPQYPGKLTDCTDASLCRCKVVNDGLKMNESIESKSVRPFSILICWIYYSWTFWALTAMHRMKESVMGILCIVLTNERTASKLSSLNGSSRLSHMATYKIWRE